jgi:hypothetical protein
VCEAVVVGRRPPRRRGVGPALQPAGYTELLETILDAAQARERLIGKCLTDFEELLDGQGAPIQGLENLLVPIGQMAVRRGCCHGQLATLASAFGWYSIFHLHESRKASLR